MVVQFTATFVVEEKKTTDWATYRLFIESLRQCKKLIYWHSHSRPVLHPQEDPPTQWFDILLQTSCHKVTLRIRRDNLYLDGYQMANSQWLEFGNKPPHLISHSTFLGFGGDYNDLERVAKQTRDAIKLGWKQLDDAVNKLAISTNGKERARSLIVVIQMICESIRFRSISTQLATKFKVDQAEPPPQWMMAQENSWRNISRELLLMDSHRDHHFQPPDPKTGIKTVEQAVEAIGMLLCCASTLEADEDGGHYPQGQPMVEVFSVCINSRNINGDEPKIGDLYGTITVADGLGTQYIYNRQRESIDNSLCDSTILLTGPARAISACGCFSINLDLVDKNDDEVSTHRLISWNVYSITNEYDKPLDEDIGSATVNYAVFKDAVKATVEITLVHIGDGKNQAHIYGLLTARNSNFTNVSVLFRKKAKEQNIVVKLGQVVRLSRSIVAVPWNSCLVVGAEVYDHISNLSIDHEIANGTAEFPAQTSGTSQKNILGKCGEIQLKVSWNN